MFQTIKLSARFIKPAQEGKLPMLRHQITMIGASEHYNTVIIDIPGSGNNYKSKVDANSDSVHVAASSKKQEIHEPCRPP